LCLKLLQPHPGREGTQRSMVYYDPTYMYLGYYAEPVLCWAGFASVA
jgi:hypothetical protein